MKARDIYAYVTEVRKLSQSQVACRVINQNHSDHLDLNINPNSTCERLKDLFPIKINLDSSYLGDLVALLDDLIISDGRRGHGVSVMKACSAKQTSTDTLGHDRGSKVSGESCQEYRPW